MLPEPNIGQRGMGCGSMQNTPACRVKTTCNSTAIEPFENYLFTAGLRLHKERLAVQLIWHKWLTSIFLYCTI